MKSTPPLLFKYKAFSTEFQRNAVEKMIKEGQVYFAKPSQLNDPFEAMPRVKAGKNHTALKPYLERAGDRAQQGSPARRLQVASEVRNQFEGQLERFDDACILSLAERHDNALLWAHYADNHRGVAIAFKSDWLPGPLPVRYAEKYPVFDFQAQDEDAAGIELLFTKAKYWEYEEEWRVAFIEEDEAVKVMTGTGLTPTPQWERLLNLSTEAVAAVYVGMNASSDTIAALRSFVKGTQVKLIRMVADPDRYGVKTLRS